jgi:thioredoxin-like negative regulator of GroEL
MPEYITIYNIHGLPLVAVFLKGEIIGKHEGALPNKDLQRVIDTILA